MSACKFCVNPALDDAVPTPMCSPCWEVHHRVKDMPIKVLNKIIGHARGHWTRDSMKVGPGTGR